MNADMLLALVKKDIALYFKNRFFAFVTVLGLVAYIAIFFLLPRSVDENLSLGWYAPQLPETITRQLQGQGLSLNTYASEEDLRAAVLDGDEPVGIALPPDFMASLAAGQKPEVKIYVQSDLPDEFRAAYVLLIEELGHALAGNTLNIEAEEIMLGPDMSGQQIAPRQRMLPILAVFILIIEALGLASLITAEVETGTLRALLVTRLKAEGLFLSKGVTGVSMAFVQVLLLLGITGGLQREPVLVLTALLLGAILVTGLSFLIASLARDLLSVMGWGILVLITLAIPAFNILLPGLASDWIKVIPSYYLVDTVHRVINFEAGWGQVSGNLALLAAYSAVFFAIGILALKRRLQ